MKAHTHETEWSRTTKKKHERECARIVNELESSPHALSLLVRLAEKLAERSRACRR